MGTAWIRAEWQPGATKAEADREAAATAARRAAEEAARATEAATDDAAAAGLASGRAAVAADRAAAAAQKEHCPAGWSTTYLRDLSAGVTSQLVAPRSTRGDK
jgi:hypothetical protein